MSDASSPWSSLVATLAAERAACEAPRPVRALAEEIARGALALLFPQFAHPARLGASGVHDEAAHLEALLRAAVTPLVADGEGVVQTFLATLPAVRD